MGTFIEPGYFAILALAILGAPVALAQTQIDPKYPLNDRARPQPAVVDPGSGSSQAAPGRPPSDAIVLFDGKDLSQWRQENGSPARWKLGDGYFEVVPGTGATASAAAIWCWGRR